MPNDAVEFNFSVSAAGNGKIKISATDSSKGFLEEKLAEGAGISLTKVTDIDGNEQIIISATGAVGDANVSQTYADVTYSSVSPIVLNSATNGTLVTDVRLSIITPFDGAIILTVGSPGRVDCLMTNFDHDVTSVGQYETWPELLYTGADSIDLYLSAIGSTQGAGTVLITARTV